MKYKRTHTLAQCGPETITTLSSNVLVKVKDTDVSKVDHVVFLDDHVSIDDEPEASNSR